MSKMKMINKMKWVAVIGMLSFFIACNNGKDKSAVMYTCPMPQDSFLVINPANVPSVGWTWCW